MKRKKILVIGTADNVGGAARVGWNIAKGVEKFGYDTKFIVGDKHSDSLRVYELKKNSLVSKLGNKIRINLVSILRYGRSFLLANDIDFGASEEILNHPWYKDADIIHMHNLHGDYFKLDTLRKISAEKPVVWTLHDKWALTAHCAQCSDCKNLNNGKHFTPGLRHIYPILWNNSDYLWNKKKLIYKQSKYLNIVTPSIWLADLVKKGILKNKPLTVINNGVDTDVFKPRDKKKVRKELHLPLKKTIIAYVAQMGTVDSRKGGKYFLETAKNYSGNPDVVFLCIGGIIGNTPRQVNNVIFVPYISDDDEKLSHYYSSADILLFTSLAENFPLVTLEALATGLPVVSFDVGGVKEQVSHKINGYVAKYKDGDDLLCGLQFILSLDRMGLKKMSLINRNKAVKEYSLGKMAYNYASLYKKLS